MKRNPKLQTKVFVVYRTDGKRPFGLFFSETSAEQFITACMDREKTAVAVRSIMWRWSQP